MLTVYGYKGCGTCRKALAWIEDAGLGFRFIDITVRPPTRALLKQVLGQSAPVSYDIGRLYNTSGKPYRELGMAQRRRTVSEAEQLDLLAGNGRLIRRPIVTDGRRFTVGFKEAEFEAVWG